jgi:hypothetical protein
MAATAAAHDWPASPVTTVNRPLPVRSSVAETRLPFRSTSHTWGIVAPVGCQKSAWPMSCGDVQGQAYGIMIIRVLAPALSHLRPALRLAGPARPVNGRQGCRAAGAAARGRRAAPRQSAAPAGLGRPRSPYRHLAPLPARTRTQAILGSLLGALGPEPRPRRLHRGRLVPDRGRTHRVPPRLRRHRPAPACQRTRQRTPAPHALHHLPAPSQTAKVRSELTNIDHGSRTQVRSELTHNRGRLPRTKPARPAGRPDTSTANHHQSPDRGERATRCHRPAEVPERHAPGQPALHATAACRGEDALLRNGALRGRPRAQHGRQPGLPA